MENENGKEGEREEEKERRGELEELFALHLFLTRQESYQEYAINKT